MPSTKFRLYKNVSHSFYYLNRSVNETKSWALSYTTTLPPTIYSHDFQNQQNGY